MQYPLFTGQIKIDLIYMSAICDYFFVSLEYYYWKMKSLNSYKT